MSYYFSKVRPLSFEAAVAEVTRTLKEEDFGIPHSGACNPTLAHEALKL